MKAYTWAFASLALYLIGSVAVAQPHEDESSKDSRLPSTYYVDPQNGNDANTGIDRQTPWRTFDKLNKLKLKLGSGDQVQVVAPGSFDHSLILHGIGSKDEPIVVTFAPGRYDFKPQHAYRHAYQISNSNGDPKGKKAVGILLQDCQHVNLIGPGAKLVYYGKMIEICLDHCRDITVSGFELDYQRPTVSEFTVAKIGDGLADLKIHPDSLYQLEDGKIKWYVEGWQYETGLAQELDPETGENWRRRDPKFKSFQSEFEPT